MSDSPRLPLCLSGLFAAAVLSSALVAEDPKKPDPADAPIQAILKKHCLKCHADQKKGDLRLDTLSWNFADEAARETWQTALKRVKAGEMPPDDKPRLSEAESKTLTEWIEGRVKTAEAARREQGRVVQRRLNRIEYEKTVCDLLGIDLDLREMLPVDSTSDGFDNVGEALHLSSFQMDRYLEAADAALEVAIANGPQPPLFSKRLTCKDERTIKNPSENVFRQVEAGVVFFTSSPWQALTLYQFYPPDRGRYRFRISARAFQSKDKPVTFRVDAGPMLMATKNHLVGYFDASPDETKVFEFVDSLEARSTIRILPYGLTNAQTVHKVGGDTWDGPGLQVDGIEVEGPLYDAWPPESHRRIFGDLKQDKAPAYNRPQRVEVVSDHPAEDAARILKSFARRAFRRNVTDAEMKPYLGLFEASRRDGCTFEQAVRVGLKAVLVSPSFLFLRETPGKLDDFALASRLSYFLWSTMPDDELLKQAEDRTLTDPAVLRQQVERMLASPKAKAFTENFVGQWLGLRDIDVTEPSHLLYPEYDDMLKVSMIRETELFFDELLRNDLSLANFVDSDFTMLNGRLAKHYGIPGVDGWEFHRVTLPPESHRGGLLTMASVLKVTANGTNTSPVIRGAWVLDRILGTPPPRPPSDVPAVEPDIRGATTIREQLAKHRQLASCSVCHRKIDPPGFALESFDVIGGYREHYRTTGNGGPVVVDGRRMPYHQGKKVDPADVLPDGRKFENIDELKKLLVADRDQLARALTKKLLTYGTGGRVNSADAADVETIVARVREKGYGLRTLVHEIVQSDVFRRK